MFILLREILILFSDIILFMILREVLIMLWEVLILLKEKLLFILLLLKKNVKKCYRKILLFCSIVRCSELYLVDNV